MRIRLRHLIAIACLGLVTGSAACSSDDSGGGGATAIGAGEYKGELSGANETGVLDVTLSGGTLSPSALRLLDTQDQATAVGTVTLNGGGSLQVAGTFDPDTGALSLSGSGYSFSGTAGSDGISGSYSGPNGPGSFTLIKGSGAQVFCGSYGGQASGVWNLVIGPSSAAGSVADSSSHYASPMACTVSGANLACTAANGVTATGTVTGGTASGTWTDGSGHSGMWKGATAACPVPQASDAGSGDATVPGDASAGDSAVPPDATPTDATSVSDANGGKDSSSGADSSSTDSATGTDSSSSTDSGGSIDAAPDSSASQDASSSDGGTDAGSATDAGTLTDSGGASDAASVDAAASDAETTTDSSDDAADANPCQPLPTANFTQPGAAFGTMSLAVPSAETVTWARAAYTVGPDLFGNVVTRITISDDPNLCATLQAQPDGGVCSFPSQYHYMVQEMPTTQAAGAVLSGGSGAYFFHPNVGGWSVTMEVDTALPASGAPVQGELTVCDGKYGAYGVARFGATQCDAPAMCD